MVRFKQRYILVQVHVERDGGELSSRDVYSAVSGRLGQAFGSYLFGALKASLQIKYWNNDTGFMIVRCARDFVRPAWMAVSSVTTVGSRRCVMQVLHCGGTIKCVKKHLLDHLKALDCVL